MSQTSPTSDFGGRTSTRSGTVIVVGLGPSGPDLLSAAARAAFAGVAPEARMVRTAHHPASAAVGASVTFDHRYETASTMDEVYVGIVDDLVAAAASHGRVAYGVPGSPLVAERTVELLRERAARGDVVLEVVPALSSSTWFGPASGSTPWRRERDWSTGTASPPRPQESGAPCWWPRPTRRSSCLR